MSTATTKYHIHTGHWTEWSRGPVLGSMITLRADDGNLLVAFIAFFVTLVGTQVWRIACFALHNTFSHPTTPSDALYHQRQALLRNIADPAGGLVRLSNLLWSWRKDGKRPFRRILPLLFITIALAAGFALASGYSAKVALGNEVLLNGKNCGVQLQDLVSNTTMNQLYLVPAWARELRIASNYAQQCYSGSTSTGALGCDTFVREQIPFSVQTNASCPFTADICRSNDSNIILDTGFIDSHRDLGVNAPPSQRFHFRRRYHCAPLVTQGRTTFINASDARNYTRYHYGKNILARDNYTFQALSNPIADARVLSGSGRAQDYSLRQANRFNGSLSPSSTFIPNAEVWKEDADVFLFFLSSDGVQFDSKTRDLWFSATTVAGNLSRPGEEPFPFWIMDNPGSPLACVAQDQWCNPSTKECTVLMPYRDAVTKAADLFTGQTGGADRHQWFFYSTLNVAFQASTAINYLGALSLTARFSLVGGIQGSLPDNQWQLEVKFWFATMLANLQKAVVNTATGPTDPHLNAWQLAPNKSAEYDMCYNQKIKSGDHMTFSLFGIVTLFVLGAVIIVVSLNIESLARFVQNRRKTTSYSLLEWSLNDVLQLQRLAHEELGIGDWKDGTKLIPITAENTLLAVLDASDPQHPRLRADPAPSMADLRKSGTSFSSSTGWSATRVRDRELDRDSSSSTLHKHPLYDVLPLSPTLPPIVPSWQRPGEGLAEDCISHSSVETQSLLRARQESLRPRMPDH
ncbi:hypothetical protein CPLU01_13089 [Colletotrichum plurivorum]|uniref:Uncharacterized protein n=1 Tax=Colletotrichum plurivorum TaxID=2175906 RepID=A0A8H6JUV9_9PEZI|nr:hypothetical protein CPLU01_13089 [Colletotrichum plurivorum]